jgi:hypothetical protein
VAEIRERVLFRRLSASRLIVYGFLALVAGGTALLELPWATKDGISLVNAFFVAVSCGTVTGLSTVSIPGSGACSPLARRQRTPAPPATL